MAYINAAVNGFMLIIHQALLDHVNLLLQIEKAFLVATNCLLGESWLIYIFLVFIHESDALRVPL